LEHIFKAFNPTFAERFYRCKMWAWFTRRCRRCYVYKSSSTVSVLESTQHWVCGVRRRCRRRCGHRRLSVGLCCCFLSVRRTADDCSKPEFIDSWFAQSKINDNMINANQSFLIYGLL
jgi:hypothetical protein